MAVLDTRSLLLVLRWMSDEETKPEITVLGGKQTGGGGGLAGLVELATTLKSYLE
jgi:hypothetical protein